MPSTKSSPDINLILKKLADKLEGWRSIVHEYQDNPKRFFEEKGFIFHPELERLFDDLFELRVRRAVAEGPRGSGKTFFGSAIATAFFLFKDFDVGIVAGSETQALTLYGYISEWLGEPEIADLYLADDPRRSYVVGIWGNKIVAKPASTKSIRGLHLGRGKRGALLIIDEEAEAEPDVIRAALYTVRTAKPGIILRMSTYHKAIGTFAELVDKAEEMGYELYQWDGFDVVEGCPYECEKCPVEEFRTKYCRGKAKRSRGWISIDDVIQSWREGSVEWFETEVMGWRPPSAGLVLDPRDVERAFVDGMEFIPGIPTWVGLDWGFNFTVFVLFQQVGDEVRILDAEHFSRQSAEEIHEKLKEWRKKYDAREIFPDSSHPFENERLVQEGFAVPMQINQKGMVTYGVVFAQYKEIGADLLRYLFERGRIKIKRNIRHREILKGQLKAWRRDQTGKIVKRDDHFPDAMLAGTKKLYNMGAYIEKPPERPVIMHPRHRFWGRFKRFFRG